MAPARSAVETSSAASATASDNCCALRTLGAKDPPAHTAIGGDAALSLSTTSCALATLEHSGTPTTAARGWRVPAAAS